MELESRVLALEKELAEIKEKLGQSSSKLPNEMLPLNQATKLIGRSEKQIRLCIQRAIAFPKKSPYKEGIHWEKIPAGEKSVRYYVNPRKWRDVKA